MVNIYAHQRCLDHLKIYTTSLGIREQHLGQEETRLDMISIHTRRLYIYIILHT